MKMRVLFCFCLVVCPMVFRLHAQYPGYWQQRIDCRMEVDLNVKDHSFRGQQRLVYYNQSPDTLDRMFYHLYFNAFKPESEMHSWSRRLPDPDPRIMSRLKDMSAEDQGFIRVLSLMQDGNPVLFEENRTILEVRLRTPLAPGDSTVLNMDFSGQVPKQTRRSGRDSDEGVAYSMVQWYPKVCNYDKKGWHAHPYVQREFYGVWGDYDVTVRLDRKYVVAATGYIQNPQEVGAGYEDPALPLKVPRGENKSWRFLAQNVHDFAWAADPDYVHTQRVMHDGTLFRFFYKKNKDNEEAWAQLPEYMDQALNHINKMYGPYPYKEYAIVQGGDGGMEYPLLTLVTGNRPLRSLVGVSVHELMHMWYQMMLGTNESYYAWMDEGFTSYASSEIMSRLFPGGDGLSTHRGSYQGYLGLARSGEEEPLTTHADHFRSNFAYGSAAYNKGSVFLHQLGYIIGKEQLDSTLLDYYKLWRFKHPTAEDFIRVAEKRSGLELDWYLEYWTATTKQIDYSVDSVWIQDGALHVVLSQDGTMPMPVDVAVHWTDEQITRVTIPMDIMRGFKRRDSLFPTTYVVSDWPWTFEKYEMVIPGPVAGIPSMVVIDPTKRMADVNPENNVYKPD